MTNKLERHRQFCSDCNCWSVTAHRFIWLDKDIGKEIVIRGDYEKCPKCGKSWIPAEVYLDMRTKTTQTVIEKWLSKRFKSVRFAERWFFSRKQALEYLSNPQNQLAENKRLFDERHLQNSLGRICFNIHVCGEEFYLKSSILRYCLGQAPKWYLDEGYHDEIIGNQQLTENLQESHRVLKA